MSLSDLWKMATDNPLDTIQGLMSIYGIFNGVSNANDAAGSLEGLTEDQIARQNQIAALYAEGGDVLRENLRNLLDEYGNFGQITPDVVDKFTNYFASERAKEEKANRAEVDVMTREDKDRLMGFEDAFRTYVQEIYGDAEDDVRTYDMYAKSTAPSTLDFARLQDDLTQKFYRARKNLGDQALAEQQAKMVANLPEGLENSTLAIQGNKAMAALAAEQEAKNLLAAIGDAQNYIMGLQTAASNQQNMTNAERNMQRNLLQDSINNATGRAALDMSGGTYGQSFANSLNAQRGVAIGELGAEQGLRNNTALTDSLAGLNYVSAENAAANTYLQNVGNIATSPYTFAAAGQNSINPTSALNALTSLTDTYSKIASSNMAGAGDWLTSLKV